MTQPSALSREQVVKECDWLIQEHCDSAARKWRDTDAAQRATIEQQAQEIAESERKLREVCMAHGPALMEIHDLKKALAAMAAERNDLDDTRQGLEAELAELRERYSNLKDTGYVAQLEQQLAKAQATLTQLEAHRKEG